METTYFCFGYMKLSEIFYFYLNTSVKPQGNKTAAFNGATWSKIKTTFPIMLRTSLVLIYRTSVMSARCLHRVKRMPKDNTLSSHNK